MKIKRDLHLQRIIDRRHNRMAKIITGVRRCGKSYLLFTLFYEWLKEQGVEENHILKINLEDFKNRKFRDPEVLYEYVTSRISADGIYYLMLDEVQMVEDFIDVLNGFLNIDNLDVYVTGSNAKYLSNDIATEFRGRGDQVRVRPLSFKEFMSVYGGDKISGLNEFMRFGGLPQILEKNTDELKTEFLTAIFTETYIKDIKERHKIRTDMELDDLISIIASSVGSLTNPATIASTFKSHYRSKLTPDTIKVYLDHLMNAFLVERAKRFDVKGRRYIDTPYKYYMVDTGLRNARLGFSHFDYGHLMENVIYNELRLRGFNVDVGFVPVEWRDECGKKRRSQLEVDFVCHLGDKRYYIQSAFQMLDEEKIRQETASLNRINDSNKKIVIVAAPIPKMRDTKGVVIMSIYDFLLDDGSLDS